MGDAWWHGTKGQSPKGFRQSTTALRGNHGDRKEKLEAFRELTEGVDAENPENDAVIAEAMEKVYGTEVFGSELSAHIATLNESEIAELLKTPSSQPRVK
jgi:hypothetical protein